MPSLDLLLLRIIQWVPVSMVGYGWFLPSWYCGTNGYATPSGSVGGEADMCTYAVV